MNIKDYIKNGEAKRLLTRILNSAAFDYFDHHKGRHGEVGGSLPRNESRAKLSRGSAKHSGSNTVNNQIESSTGLTGAAIRSWALENNLAVRQAPRRAGGGAKAPKFTHQLTEADIKGLKKGDILYASVDGKGPAKMFQYDGHGRWITNTEGQFGEGTNRAKDNGLKTSDIVGMTGVLLHKEQIEEARAFSTNDKGARTSTRSNKSVQGENSKSSTTMTERKYNASKISNIFKVSGERSKELLLAGGEGETEGGAMRQGPLTKSENDAFQTLIDMPEENVQKFDTAIAKYIDANNSILNIKFTTNNFETLQGEYASQEANGELIYPALKNAKVEDLRAIKKEMRKAKRDRKFTDEQKALMKEMSAIEEIEADEYSAEKKVVDNVTKLISKNTVEEPVCVAKAVTMVELNSLFPDTEGLTPEQIVKAISQGSVRDGRYQGFYACNSNKDALKMGDLKVKIVTALPTGTHAYTQGEPFGGSAHGEDTLLQVETNLGCYKAEIDKDGCLVIYTKSKN